MITKRDHSECPPPASLRLRYTWRLIGRCRNSFPFF